MYTHLSLLEELLRYVGLDDLHALELLETLHRQIFLVVPPEVLNVFGVGELLLCRIFAMVLLEVVDLVLILNVAVVARTESQIGQPSALGDDAHPIVAGDEASIRGVEEREHLSQGLALAILCGTCIRLIVHAVCLAHFLGSPCPGFIIVVKGEEGSSIEGINVMLLCSIGARESVTQSIASLSGRIST